jgi:hypothetical protein
MVRFDESDETSNDNCAEESLRLLAVSAAAADGDGENGAVSPEGDEEVLEENVVGSSSSSDGGVDGSGAGLAPPAQSQEGGKGRREGGGKRQRKPLVPFTYSELGETGLKHPHRTTAVHISGPHTDAAEGGDSGEDAMEDCLKSGSGGNGTVGSGSGSSRSDLETAAPSSSSFLPSPPLRHNLRHNGARAGLNACGVSTLPPLYSAVEGASPWATPEHVDRDVQARARAVEWRKERGLWHPDVEGRMLDFLADRGPRVCHCSGRVGM